MGLLGIAIAICIIATLIGYFFNTPLPEGVSDRWKLKLIYGWFKVAGLIVMLGEKLGYDTSLNISRKVVASFFAMTSYHVSNEGLLIENKAIEGVPIRIYRPNDVSSSELLPVVVYYHGGGMISFSVDTYDNVLRFLSKTVRAVVIAPEYRLSPEHKYPAPLDDCVKVTRHVMNEAKDYGGDVNRVALTGDSAGGNIAAAVALKLANTSTNGRQPKLQVLLYPMLQLFDFQLPSYSEDPFGDRATIVGAWYMYCTGKPPIKLPELLSNKHISPTLKNSKCAKYVRFDQNGESRDIRTSQRESGSSDTFDSSLAEELESCITDPYVSPLMASDFTKFPPSYVLTCQFDILRDEGLMFVNRLKEARVEIQHEHIHSGWHGMVSFTRTDGGNAALQKVVRFLIEKL